MSRSRRSARAVAFLVAAHLAALACATPGGPVPDGVYHDPSGEEHLLVAHRSIAIHIRIEEEDGTSRFLARSHTLTVYDDGTLGFAPIATTDLFTGVGRFDWRWDGETIERTDLRTGEVTRFRRGGP